MRKVLTSNILLSVFFFCNCMPTSKPEKMYQSQITRDEYTVTFKNGKAFDTTLTAQSVYDENGNLLKKITYYKKKF